MLTLILNINKTRNIYTKFFDEFLILVQFFQSFRVHVRNIVGLGLVTMLLIAKNTYLHLWSRNILQPDIIKVNNNQSSKYTKLFLTHRSLYLERYILYVVQYENNIIIYVFLVSQYSQL